jgi:hypothetical protein
MKDSDRAKQWIATKPSLPAGRYLLKVHVDAEERLKSEWTGTLGDAELVGEAIIESRWRKGYEKMTVVEASLLRRLAAN